MTAFHNVAMELTQHAKHVLSERGIDEKWIWMALADPDRVDREEDGTTHYLKSIAAHGGHFLRVVVNANVEPNRVVTAFFDRRLGRSG